MQGKKKFKQRNGVFLLFLGVCFYIAYAVALIPCFICNLAIDKTLSWFWIVFSALLLAFTFTNLPKIIKRYKLILIPLSQYLALFLLLGVCCIYTNGNWFFIATLSVLLGLSIIFVPLFIAKYSIFSKIKKYNGFISLAINFILLNLLLVVINGKDGWYINLALPIVLYSYLALNIIISTKFLKCNQFFKISIKLLLSALFLYLPPTFLKVKSVGLQKEIDSINILKTNFSNWIPEIPLENNVHCIIFLSLLTLSLIFFVVGFIKHRKQK